MNQSEPEADTSKWFQAQERGVRSSQMVAEKVAQGFLLPITVIQSKSKVTNYFQLSIETDLSDEDGY